ncbi:SH3 domain-containing protein [Microvirga roseola]|uniref:SH3 domain-containing protein n=1 Tax=Microvirga roseola TaxID=2883126 RepID=UPI001E4CB352|nr:SH3 domain-containing protein [Microvirga roseola]
MLKKIVAIAAVAAGLVLPGSALAAPLAFTTTDLNIRTGPAASYQRFDTIPEGGRVTVHGCLTGYNWCDVTWAGERGWVSGNYLAYAGERYARQPIPSVAFSIGVPVIGFDPGIYHRRYYVDRPWYRDRYLERRWAREPYFDRRDAFREHRELRDARRAVREEQRDVFDARRDLQRERRVGGNVRDERRQLQRERRELLEARQELRRERRD